jgi:tetratricopeptide (TPR) repeat protein
MGMIIDVPEELSKKVVTNLIKIIEAEKSDQKKDIRKICSQCLTYLSIRELYFEKAEANIQFLKSDLPDQHAFYLLLLGVLNEAIDEDEVAIEYFKKFAESSLADSFRDELLDFIELGRFQTLSDYSQFEKAGLIFIDKYSSKSEISDLLWQLSTCVNPSEYIPTFEKFCARALELYPDNYGIEHFHGFIKDQSSDFEASLELYLFVKDKIEKEVENPETNLRLANIWHSIADCYLKLKNPEKAIESCDIAMTYDEKSEGFQIKNFILNKKAEALLLRGEKESALSIINRLLEENPKDEVSQNMLEKIKNL